MPHQSCYIAILATASLLAGGCYCPMLSGRYCDCRCFPSGMPSNCGAPDSGQAGLVSCGLPHGCCLSSLFPGLAGGSGGSGNVPSQQGPDYLSPQAKFHPIPTRPAFESQPLYPPTELIEPGGTNPLRPTTATIATARAATVR